METAVPYWISYQKPSIQEVRLQELQGVGIKLLLWREDQNHPKVSGNKWWKLKYNVQEAVRQKRGTILTFGGAYSNHIYATAAACHELGLKSIGIIRGEEVLPLNETLTFAREHGMQLNFVSRESYRKKNDPEFVKALENKFGRCFIIPEGGTNDLAVRGTEELGKNLLETEFDYLCLPVGTGGTMVGIVNAFEGQRKIVGVPVLKDGEFLNDEIKKFVKAEYANWQLRTEYHFGGYAKRSPELMQFISNMREQGIPLEFVYSGKLVWAVVDLAKKGFFEKGSTVMMLHTGGLRSA
jgi:1-aminocyclopropane-1-carboxylate deaminase